MDSVRYYLALVALVTIPPAILYWFIVHPFVGFWRRVGKRTTFWILAVVFVGCGYVLWLFRAPLLGADYGTNPWLWPPALAFYVGATWLQLHVKKHLSFSIMAGAPELEADGTGGRLLQEGVYARVRHPRYLAVALSVVGWALFTNFLGMYGLVVVTVLGLAGIARIEERELRARFGAEYDAYRERVPMIIPRPSAARGARPKDSGTSETGG